MFLKLFNESPDSSESYFFVVVFFFSSPECLTAAENVAKLLAGGLVGGAVGGTSHPESMLGLALPNCSGL